MSSPVILLKYIAIFVKKSLSFLTTPNSAVHKFEKLTNNLDTKQTQQATVYHLHRISSRTLTTITVYRFLTFSDAHLFSVLKNSTPTHG